MMLQCHTVTLHICAAGDAVEKEGSARLDSDESVTPSLCHALESGETDDCTDEEEISLILKSIANQFPNCLPT